MSNTQQEDARGSDQRGGGGHLRLLTPERTVPGPGYLEDRHMARTFHMNRLDRMNNALFRTLIQIGVAPGGASL